MTKYFLAIIPPPKIAKTIDIWREKYYPYGLKNVPPHITLVSPFLIDREVNSLSKELVQIVNNTKVFDVHINGFDSFTHQQSVFFAKVQPSPEIFKLQYCLASTVHIHTNLSKLKLKPVTFVPHITIANRLNNSQLLHIRHEIEGRGIYADFTVSEFCLLVKPGRDPYQITERYSLDK